MSVNGDHGHGRFSIAIFNCALKSRSTSAAALAFISAPGRDVPRIAHPGYGC
jgi:hypothetical protein